MGAALKQMRQNLLLHILTGVVVLPVMVCTYWLIRPYTPIVETAEPRPVSQTIYPGDTFAVMREFCVNVDEVTESVRSLITADGTKISLPSVKHDTPPGCHTRKHVIATPPWIPPGVYQYHAGLTLDVNPLRSMTVRMLPVTVVVDPRPQ